MKFIAEIIRHIDWQSSRRRQVPASGEHGLSVERQLAYEESIRTPLLVRFPARIPAHIVREELALNPDLAPTLLELTGTPVPETMQGRSLVPLLKSEQSHCAALPRSGAGQSTYWDRGRPRPQRAPAQRQESPSWVSFDKADEWRTLFARCHLFG
ncbi:MAG TPA: sulfatase/phosphatase domain-containing protein [Pyrinomonadaceae bacterium]|nr:sulfatase/phosphatase domain-containing protein [Pyrinomonadaceae bacterium]